MPVYRGKAANTWRVVVWAPSEPGAPSKAHERIVRGSKREAEEYEARWRLELKQQTVRAYRVAPTFEQFCAETFVPYIRKRVAKSTWTNHYQWSILALAESLGAKRVTEISVLDVERYQTEREAGHALINAEVRILRSILRYAESRFGLPVQRIDVRGLKVTEGRVRVWTREQVDTILATARTVSPWLVPLLIFGFNTGCRKGEIVACEWSWLDFSGSMIRIPVTEYWHPKSGKPREVPMADAVRAVLQTPLRRRDKRWVFPARDGGRFAAFPDEPFERVLTHAKLDGSPHMMRHTFASLFLQRQPDLFLLAKILGHAATYTTELYGHLLPEHLARARNAVNIGAGPTEAEPQNHGSNHG